MNRITFSDFAYTRCRPHCEKKDWWGNFINNYDINKLSTILSDFLGCEARVGKKHYLYDRPPGAEFVIQGSTEIAFEQLTTVEGMEAFDRQVDRLADKIEFGKYTRGPSHDIYGIAIRYQCIHDDKTMERTLALESNKEELKKTRLELDNAEQWFSLRQKHMADKANKYKTELETLAKAEAEWDALEMKIAQLENKKKMIEEKKAKKAKLSADLVRNECIICTCEEAVFVGVPCGHPIMCIECSKDSRLNLDTLPCPVCRQGITSMLRIWINT